MRGVMLVMLCLVLGGCGTLPFKNPLFTVEFGPLITVNVGARHEKQEINAYGSEAARLAIGQATEAVTIEIPKREEKEQGDGGKSRNLW